MFFPIVYLFLLLLAPEPAIQRIDGTSIGTAELSAAIEKHRQAAGVTGLAVTVLNDGQPVYRQAFGLANAGQGESLRTDHVFYAASFSKAVFGYLVATLALDGLIDLDQPLQEQVDVPLPDLPVASRRYAFHDLKDDARYRSITARMCLTHSSGLPNWRWLPHPVKPEPDGRLEFFFDPGERYSYSGEGMWLLQHVLEVKLGRGLEALARERVFEPLGMTMSSYRWQDRFKGRHVVGHDAKGKTLRFRRSDRANAAASMVTTPEDYARFFRHLLELAAKDSPITELLFSPYRRIRTRTQFGPGALESSSANDDIALSYGLGWGLLSTPYGPGAFKEGHDNGYQHYSILFPERGSGVILMSNSDRAESTFKYLLELTIADRYTPWRWENYIPYDLNAGK